MQLVQIENDLASKLEALSYNYIFEVYAKIIRRYCIWLQGVASLKPLCILLQPFIF